MYVRPFPGIGDGLWQVSDAVGVEPRWSRDGSELFFRAGADIWGVSVTAEPTFAASAPRRILDGTTFWNSGNRARTYDVGPDGRFLLLRSHRESRDPARGQLPGMILVLDWVSDLRRLVPTGR